MARVSELEALNQHTAEEHRALIETLQAENNSHEQELVALKAQTKQLQADRRLLKQAVRQLRDAAKKSASAPTTPSK